MKIIAISAALCVCLFSISCLKKNSFVCTFDACATVAPATEVQVVEAYIASQGITGAVKHCSGMYYKITAPGTGAMPTNCSAVSATYKGYLNNGNVFDEQTSPVAFELSRVIRGWQIGLPMIKEAGKISLYVPASLGYGSQANGPIPANSMLIFDITLIATQ